MRYSELFVGRSDTYAVSKGPGDYRPVKGIMTPKRLTNHILGKETLGMYLIRKDDDSVRMMALDLDRDDEGLVKAICQSAVVLVPDTSVLAERTGGRGWHIWIFPEDWIPARKARAILRSILSGVELPYPVEMYPKQDFKGRGLGNLLRIPLGVHQRTGNRSQLYNAFGLPIEIDPNDPDPDIPIEPASMEILNKVADEQLSGEAIPENGGESSAPGTRNLPCIEAFQKGVSKGVRDEAMFRLAAFYHRQQIPKEAAFVAMREVNSKNKPPLDDASLNVKVESAYSGQGYGLPCSSDLVGLDTRFCDPACPVYNTAKGRRTGAGSTRDLYPRIIERDKQYVLQTKTQLGIRENVISNFSMDVVSRLEMPDGKDVLRARLSARSGREEVMDIPIDAFASRTGLLRVLSRAEFAWFGTDQHCQYLKSHLSSQPLPTQIAITKLGRATLGDADLWVFPDGILSSAGELGNEGQFTYHRPAHFGDMHISMPSKGFTREKSRSVARSLWKLNDIRVMSSIIGWSFAVPFKPWFVRKFGHFPLLMLYGTRGAGKTQVVQKTVMPLFGYNPREPQIHFCDTTRFVLMSYGASSTTVPLFFDEYRPNAMAGTKLRQLWDHWRHLYAEDTDHRGQADLSRLDFPQTAPIVVAGEEMVIDPAMQERMVQVPMSPDFLTDERILAFNSLPPLESMCLEFTRHAMNTDPEDLLNAAKEMVSGKWERKVSPRIYDNILAIGIGLASWSIFSGSEITEKIRDSIFDTSPMVHDEEGNIRTLLWVDGFLLDIARILEDKGMTSWGCIEQERQLSYMYFNFRGAHAEWSRDMRARGEMPVGMEPLRRQLSEQSSSKFVEARAIQKRLGAGTNARVYKVNLTAMREALDE